MLPDEGEEYGDDGAGLDYLSKDDEEDGDGEDIDSHNGTNELKQSKKGKMY